MTHQPPTAQEYAQKTPVHATRPPVHAQKPAIHATNLPGALKHGKRTTDRMVAALLAAIMAKLSEGITLDGNKVEVRQLGEIKEQDGIMRLLFDVKNPDETFDHIEFKVIKTGWGRSL